MKKQTPKPDENQMAFNGLQELLRRDAARDEAAPKDKPKKQRTAKHPLSPMTATLTHADKVA